MALDVTVIGPDPAGAVGVKLFDAAEAALAPAELVACTVQV